jgi:hypothetical protein
MKKSILFVGVLFFMGTTNVSAQRFGIQAGPAFSSGTQKVSMEEMFSIDMDYKTAVTFTGGIYGNFNFGKMLAIQPELNYLQKGGVYSEDGEELDVRVNFLELPIYILFNGGQSTGFYGGVGPAFNFGMSGKYKMDGEEMKIEFGKDKDIQAFHMAINGQAGYQWENGFNVNFFLSQTLTNSESEMEVVEEEGSFKATNKFSFLTYGLRVGYRFNFDKSAAKTQLKTVF